MRYSAVGDQLCCQNQYGGSIDNRLCFPLMLVNAVIGFWGCDRNSIRVSPTGTFDEVQDDGPEEPEGTLARELSDREIACIEVVEHSFPSNSVEGRSEAVILAIRGNCQAVCIANGNDAPHDARQRIKPGQCGLVSFGQPFLSNHDFLERIRMGAELNPWYEKPFYCGDKLAYTGYPALD